MHKLVFFSLCCNVICCVKCVCRHQSKFRRLVQDEAVKSKAAYRTMGPAKVQTKPPDQFLKKHEKDLKMPQSELYIFSIMFGFSVTTFVCT